MTEYCPGVGCNKPARDVVPVFIRGRRFMMPVCHSCFRAINHMEKESITLRQPTHDDEGGATRSNEQ